MEKDFKDYYVKLFKYKQLLKNAYIDNYNESFKFISDRGLPLGSAILFKKCDYLKIKSILLADSNILKIANKIGCNNHNIVGTYE